MPMLNRILNPHLPIDSTENDGAILTADPVIVGGGGSVPLPKPPIVGTDHDDILFGSDGNDTIYGLGGDDWIHGGKGADKMIGGQGDDNFFVDNSGDVVVENAGEGHDSVYSTIDYHLGNNVEDLYLDGHDAINGWGNDLNNVIVGNDSNNMLFGNGGGDHLDGGKGADVMLGGDGDDLYTVDNVGDVVWELAGQGTDGVYSSISYSLGLGSNVENLYLIDEGGAIDGTGNELDNVIFGNSSHNVLKGGLGNDWIDGKGGNDKMYGGEGDDTFVVDSINDVVVEYDNQGNDTVYSTATYFLSNNVETLMLKEEGGAINGYGNDSDNTIYGNSFANDLGGYAGTDYIRAGGGKDTIDGGAGNDFLWGNSGDDTFRFHGDFGHDWIEDFKAGGDHDIIELDHNQFADFAAVQAAMVQNIGSTSIVLDADHSISLEGVNAADLHASDFHFV